MAQAAADVTGLGAARPLYENTVLQSGVCNITSEDGLDAPVPVIDMPHLIPTVRAQATRRCPSPQVQDRSRTQDVSTDGVHVRPLIDE